MTAALIYAALAALPLGFQIALVFGAPWGHLTMGGYVTGRLPARRWAFAGFSALLLAAMALAMLDRGGVIGLQLPAWAGWAALGLTALTTLANLATPSLPERKLWGPVAAGMLVSGALVMFG